MWSQASRQKHQKRHSTSHNLLSHQPFPVLTLSPFRHTHDPNTHKFMCNCTMSFKRNKSAKMLIPRQNIKKGEQRGGGTSPQRQKQCTHKPSTYPHYPLSNTFLLISSALLPATWFSHTMLPKTQHLPSPARESDKERKRGGGSFFPSQKDSNHRIVWIHCQNYTKQYKGHRRTQCR